MHMRYMNALGVLIVVVIMAVTPLVPHAVSAPEPQWVWDENGKVHDANGFYRPMTDEEVAAMFGIDLSKSLPATSTLFRSISGDSDGGGSC